MIRNNKPQQQLIEIEKNNFANTIYDITIEKELTYLEAILYYCSNTGLEIEVVSNLINTTLKEKLASEAKELHLLVKK